MMKNPYFVSLFPYVTHPMKMNAREGLARDYLSAYGQNTGNILFTAALHKAVVSETYGCGYSFDPDQVAEQHDGILVSAANWLSPYFDMPELVELIEKTSLPVVIVGVGAQSNARSAIPPIKKSTQRLIDLSAASTHSISARGDFSAEVLLHYGARDVEVTGCPSLLWHLGDQIEFKPVVRDTRKIAIHSTRHGLNFLKLAGSENHRLNLYLYRLAIRERFDLVLQSELSDFSLLMDDPISDAASHEACQIYGFSDIATIQDYLRNCGKYFSGVSNWIEYARDMDFFLGTRIHGTVAAILAGTPAVLICHDTRTEEMARVMNLPHIASAAVKPDEGIDWNLVFDTCDLAPFSSNYRKYVDNFASFFDSNKVKHRLPVLEGGSSLVRRY